MFLPNVLHEKDAQPAAAMGYSALLCQEQASKQPGVRILPGHTEVLALPHTSYARREEPCGAAGAAGSGAMLVLVSHLPFRPPGAHNYT